MFVLGYPVRLAMSQGPIALARLMEGCGALISIKDLEGRYVFLDRHHEERLGLAPGHSTGKTDRDLFPSDLALSLRSHDCETLSAGKARQFREDLIFSDGIGTFTSFKCPALDSDGTVYGVLTVALELVSPLDEGEHRYRTLLESTSDIVTVLDLTGAVRYVTPSVERVLGYSPEERLGVSTFEIIHPDDLPVIRRIFTEGINRRVPSASAAARFRRKDGSWCVLEVVARNLLDVPSVRGIVVTSRDMTEHNRVEAALRSSEAALLRLTAGLFKAQEEERSRVSRELHDDLNQKLALLAVEVESLESDLPQEAEGLRPRLQALRDRTGKLSDDVRRTAYQLHPSVLEHLGLVAALRSYVADLSEHENLKVHFTPKNVPEILEPDVALCLYRVAQEALRNVARHSGGREAWLALRRVGSTFRLSIADRGTGFEAGAAADKPGLGLVSMRERVRAAGGSLSIESSPGGGTRIEVTIPLPETHA